MPKKLQNLIIKFCKIEKIENKMNGHNVFFKSKTVYLQGFWPKSVYLKCFGIQLKTVYLRGPHFSRPRFSRPCCILMFNLFCQNMNVKRNLSGSGFSHPKFLDGSGFSHPKFFDSSSFYRPETQFSHERT